MLANCMVWRDFFSILTCTKMVVQVYERRTMLIEQGKGETPLNNLLLFSKVGD